MRKLYLPESIGMMCCASYHGWILLVATKGREVFLLNPLTRSQIKLPPFTTPVKCLGNDALDGPGFELDASHFFDSDLDTFATSKMTFSTDLNDPNCVITIFLRGWWVICCRVGDLCWTRVANCEGRRPIDVTYYNRRFYLLYEGSMDIIESNENEEKNISIFEPELRDVSMRFLEGKHGVHVVAFLPGDNVELYQLEEKPLKLKVTGTSDTIIFCGSYFFPYLAVCSKDWDSVEGDSMYMECNCLYNTNKHGLGSHYSIFCAEPDGNTIEHIVRHPGKNKRLLAPEPAMWFQPSFN